MQSFFCLIWAVRMCLFHYKWNFQWTSFYKKYRTNII